MYGNFFSGTLSYFNLKTYRQLKSFGPIVSLLDVHVEPVLDMTHASMHVCAKDCDLLKKVHSSERTRHNDFNL